MKQDTFTVYAQRRRHSYFGRARQPLFWASSFRLLVSYMLLALDFDRPGRSACLHLGAQSSALGFSANHCCRCCSKTLCLAAAEELGSLG